MRILIIGCGRTGAGLAQALALRGHTVTVVDKDPAAFARLGPKGHPGFRGETIAGDGFNRELLLRAGIERADGLAVLTTHDDVNAVIARLAREVFGVPRVVARLYDPRKAEIYRRLGLLTIAPVTWEVNRMADLLCYSPLDVTGSLGSGEVDLVEAEVSPLLAGRPVETVNMPGEATVLAISRGNRTFLATAGAICQAGDVLHLAVLASATERLKALLGAR
jgi:trk system potassium uptake protein TrkA